MVYFDDIRFPVLDLSAAKVISAPSKDGEFAANGEYISRHEFELTFNKDKWQTSCNPSGTIQTRFFVTKTRFFVTTDR